MDLALEPNAALIFLLAFLAIYVWYRRPERFPPGPRGIPLLGVLPFTGKFMEQALTKWSATYGPVMSVRIGRRDAVVFNDYESVIEAFVKNKEAFSGRPAMNLVDELKRGEGIIFADYGPATILQRKFGLKALRGNGVGQRGMEERVREEVAYLNRAIQDQQGKPFDIRALLMNAISNNICSVIFGRRFDYDDKAFKELIFNFTKAVRKSLRPVMFAPFLSNLPPFSGRVECLKRFVLNSFEFAEKIIDEHEDDLDPSNPRDFTDAFLAEMMKNDDFTKAQLLQYVQDLFVAGSETTTSTLRWAILCLLHYPRTQAKLYAEILKVLGNETVVGMSSRSEMPYTLAFIEEVYRFRTLVPLSILHKTNEEVHFRGFIIPKNTTAVMNIWAVHNDPKTFPQPNKFDPERHLGRGGEFAKSNHVIPFGVGPRQCLGEQLARMEVFIFLVSLVQRFEFLPDPYQQGLPDIVNGTQYNSFVPLNFTLVAKER